MRDTPSSGGPLPDTARPWSDRLLPPLGHRANRAPAGERILDLHDFGSWRDTAWRIAEDFLDERVRHAFRRSPPEYVVLDDLGWLDDLVRQATGREVDSKSLMAEHLQERFDVLRCCHATNTGNVETYYRHGIVPLDPDRAHEAARAIFLDGRFPELSATDVEMAIAEVGHRSRTERVLFEANEWLLVEQYGHYLLYRGEYLKAIAAHLGGPGRRDYRQVT